MVLGLVVCYHYLIFNFIIKIDLKQLLVELRNLPALLVAKLDLLLDGLLLELSEVQVRPPLLIDLVLQDGLRHVHC